MVGRPPFSGGASYNPAAQAYFDLHAADGGVLSDETKALFNTWFMASESYRPHIARLLVPVNDAASLNGALVPQVRVGGNAKDTNHGFLAGDLGVNGLTGDGVAKYLDTGLDPILAGLDTTKLGIHAFSTLDSPFDDYACAIGASGPGGSQDQASLLFINQAAPNDNLYGTLGNAGVASIFEVISDVTIGLFSVMAFDGTTTNARCYKNGAGLTAATPAASFIGASLGSLAVFARNAAGTPDLFCSLTLGAYVVTDSMSDTEMASLYADLHALLQGLGRVA